MFEFSKKSPIYFLMPALILAGLVVYALIITLTVKDIELANGCDEKNAPFIKEKLNDNKHKISFCDKYDKNIITIQSEYIKVGRYISFDYIGNPNGPDTSIYLEDKDLNKYVITNLGVRGDEWLHRIIKVPDHFKGEIRVVANDGSANTNGWLGIGNVVAVDNAEIFKVSTYMTTILYILLFSFFVSALFGFYLKNNKPLEAFIYMSLSTGIVSLIVFYTYLYSLQFGQTMSTLIFIALVMSLYRLNFKRLKISILLFSLLASMMTIITFLAYSDVEIISGFQALSANRWHHLPIDNWIPKIFADAILQGNIPSPMVGSWLSSDRPPLQTGFFLIFSIFSSSELHYLVASIGMQLLVIIFVAMLLMRYVKERNYIFFVMILIFFNGFIFVHSLFVWPKLLSGLYQGIAFYFLFHLWNTENKQRKEYVFFGIASSLAFLSHGGSVFYLLSLSILLLFTLKNRNEFRDLFYGFISAIFIYLPWVLYQKLIDPPGDRLLKWHLAGRNDVTDQTFLEVFFNYYEKLSLPEWLNLQAAHFERIYYSFYLDMTKIFSLTYNRFLDNVFFNIDYSFLFFSIFLSFLYFFAKNELQKFKPLILLLISSYLIYTIIWSLILTRGTVIHQGSYFAWFNAFITVTLIVYFVNRYIFYILGVLNLIIFAMVYLSPYILHSDIISGTVVIVMIPIYVWFLYLFTGTQKNRDENKSIK